jgi:fibronectin type 3 domain-containing protein
MHTEEHDADAGKGAVEQDKPEQQDNTSLSGQLPHRPENKMIDGNDTDFPEPGENPEHSGEPVGVSMEQRNEQSGEQDMNRKPEENPEGKLQDQDPGHAQKQNQSDKKDDDLAA